MEPVEPQLPRFYAGREVLITGATGLMGKVLVERLLSTCPAVERLHLLMRPRKGQAIDQRLEHLKGSQLFDNLRVHSPEQLDKLMAVPGDVTEPQLGLDATAIRSLKEVSVVFHGAATVKFSEPLSAALAHNTLSALHVMDVCDMLPTLLALVHVSTAYTSTELADTEERVYETRLTLSEVLKLLDENSPEEMEEITPELIAPHPNTYVFTKALAEFAVARREPRNYSVTIFRPTIVVSSHRAPFPGWVEGFAGIMGVVVGVGRGALRVFRTDKRCRADLVPVDVAVDNMIAVGWETAIERPSATRVYYCGSQERPVTWGEVRDLLCAAAVHYPMDHVLYYPFVIGCRTRYLHKVLEILIQTAPLYLMEYVSRVCGVKWHVNLITVAQRLSSLTEVLGTFASREWNFRHDNMRRLRDKLQHSDGHLFYLDIRAVHWEEHVCAMHVGARRHVLRQDDEGVPRARARARLARLRLVHYAVLVLAALCCVKLFALVAGGIISWLYKFCYKSTFL